MSVGERGVAAENEDYAAALSAVFDASLQARFFDGDEDNAADIGVQAGIAEAERRALKRALIEGIAKAEPLVEEAEAEGFADVASQAPSMASYPSLASRAPRACSPAMARISSPGSSAGWTAGEGSSRARSTGSRPPWTTSSPPPTASHSRRPSRATSAALEANRTDAQPPSVVELSPYDRQLLADIRDGIGITITERSLQGTVNGSNANAAHRRAG